MSYHHTCLHFEVSTEGKLWEHKSSVILTWERFQVEWSHCRHFCDASVMRLAGCVHSNEASCPESVLTLYGMSIHWMKNWISDLSCVHELSYVGLTWYTTTMVWYIWQSHVEVHYSVAYFNHIAAFKTPYCWTSVEGGAHACTLRRIVSYSCIYEVCICPHP